MFRSRSSHLAALVVAAALAGCGSDDEGQPLSQSASSELLNQLGVVERQMEEGGDACGRIQSETLPRVQSLIEGLPQDTDSELRDALEQSFMRLGELSDQECDDTEPEPPPVTETTPPPVTETTPPPTVTVPPPETQPQQNGNNGNNGNRGNDDIGESPGINPRRGPPPGVDPD